MAYLPTNSTNTLLLANQEFVGEAVAVDKEYISVTCSFNTNVGGVLEFFHSIDGFAFSNYADIYDFTDKAGSHSIEVSVKGKYFKIRYINGNQNQGVFNLFCKLNVTVGEAILNATYDTITVFAGGENGFNIRELTTDDEITIPTLNKVLTSDSGVSALQCKITSMPPIVIPPITISSVNIKDSNGGDILADAGTLRVSQISGFATSANQVTAQASLNSLVAGTRILASNGNLITCDASNNLNTVVKNDVSISGITSLSTSALQTSGNALLTQIKNKTLDSNSDSVTVYAGGENGFNIRTLSSTTDSVDVGLGTYTWSNRVPPFPASRDVLSSQLCGVSDLAGSTLINLVSNPQGALLVDTGLTSLFISNPSLNVNTGLTSLFISNPSLNVNTGLTSLFISNPSLNVDTGLTSLFISNPSLNVNTGLTSLFISNPSLNVNTGLTSLSVSNFPESQTIDGSVNIKAMYGTNNPIDVIATQYGAIASNIRTSTGYELQFILNDDNLPILQTYISNDIGITGNINIGNFPAGITHVYVDNFPAGITVNNFPTSIGITGNPDVHISNTTLDVLVDASTSSVLIYGSYNGTGTSIKTNATGSLDIVGFVDANCSGIIESKTLDGAGLAITSTGVSSQVGLDVYVINTSLKIEPGATFASSNTFKNSVYDSTGAAITSSVPITGKNTLDTSSILYGKSGASSIAPITSTLNGTRQELDISIDKAVDTHLYAKKPISGGAQEVLHSDNNHHLAVRLTNDDESKYNTFDTDGGLNCHITNTSLPISITDVTAKIQDSSGNTITSLTTPSNCVGSIKTALYGQTTNNAIGDSNAAPHGTTKTGLNNFIVNSYSLPVMCGGYDGTNTQGFKTTTGGSQFVAIDTNNSTIKIASTDNTIKISSTDNTIKIASTDNTVQFSQTSNQNNIKITDAGGDIATVSTPYLPSGTSSIRGLDTQACINALDIYNNTYDNVTLTPSTSGPNAGYKALDTYVRNPSTTVNNSIFGASGTNTGINMYPVPIKQKQLVMSGTTATANGILGGLNSTQTISNVDWGITKPKTFYISMTAGGTAKTFFYDYIDTNGNERTMNYTIPAPISNWYALPLQTGFTEQMVGINNVRVSASLTINDTYFISTSTSSANTVCSGTYARTLNAVITIPNNAIGYVSNVFMFNAIASNFNLWKYDAITGARKNIYYYNTAFATNHMASGYEGALGGILQPGEAVLGGNENSNSMVVFANVVIKYLS